MKIFVVIALFFVAGFCHGQKDSFFALSKRLPLSASYFAVDNLDALYILTTSGQLKKFNSNGDSAGVYNEVRRLGKPYSIDVSNPLRPLLFYKDFSSVVILDRQLSVRTTIDLRTQNIIQASAVGLSYDNNIWVYDAVENKLKKIDEGGGLLFETGDLRTVFQDVIVPEQIIDQDNSVYLYDPKLGLYQFDYYGTFQKKHAVSGWKNISLINKQVAGIYQNGISVLNPSTLLLKQYQFPSSFGSFQQYLIGNTKLFALTADSISVYTFRF